MFELSAGQNRCWASATAGSDTGSSRTTGERGAQAASNIMANANRTTVEKRFLMVTDDKTMTGVQFPVMSTSDIVAGCRAEPGTLYVVATPIGHLADLSPRAAAILGQVDLIAAEDTRVSRRLLSDRQKPVEMVSVNEHSEADRVGQLIERLQAGQSVALVSDAGTPLISDPGFRLVAAAHEAGLPVSPVAGALRGDCGAVGGRAGDRSVSGFEGFLPARSGPRRSRLESLQDQESTLVFYVPARDLAPVLNDMAEVFGADRPATLTRELTKTA